MKKILIVDDDQDLLHLLQELLQRHSFEVEAVEKTSEVFPAIEQFHPDLIIMDIHLSGFDGRDICRELKSHSSTKKIPVIIVSGDTAKQEQLRKAGADDFVEKPLDSKLLLDSIETHLRLSQIFE